MDGSTIGVDTATTHITDGEIYALEHDGMLRVKFVYRLPGGGIRLRSFNREEYPDEVLAGGHAQPPDQHDRLGLLVVHRTPPARVPGAVSAWRSPALQLQLLHRKQPELYFLQRRVAAGGNTVQPTIAPTTPIPRQETVELVCIFGDVLVPLEQVRERWFRNLNKENFSKALACGRIALPVTTLDDSHKAMQFVALDHLAAYVDQRANQAGSARRAQPGADSIAS